jgi:hypothetical protein
MHHEYNQSTQDPCLSNTEEESDCPDVTGVGHPSHPDLSTSEHEHVERDPVTGFDESLLDQDRGDGCMSE